MSTFFNNRFFFVFTLPIAVIMVGCASTGMGSFTIPGLHKPYTWKDNKGNRVEALQGTIRGRRPNNIELPLQQIRDQFFGVGGMALAWDQAQNYLRNDLSSLEQTAFFRAIQRGLADTGKVSYKLNYPGSYVEYIGIPNGFDAIYPLNAP